LFIKKIIV